jgi:dipeptidyl aminopeptidase/acylaminoacyl peptidase
LKFKTVFITAFITLFCFSLGAAQDVEEVQNLLTDIDSWVTSDTARIKDFIDSTNAVAKETLKSSEYWDKVEGDLSFLLGIDLITSPQIDNTGRIYFSMRLTGDQTALFYVDEPMGWPIQITPNNWPKEGIIISAYAVHPSGDFIIVRTNKYGDEMHDLWRFERDGSFKPLLVSRERRYYGPIFDEEHPEHFFLFIMEGPNINVAEYNMTSGALDTLYNEPGAFYAIDYHDGKILLYRSISFSETQLAMYDIATEKVTDLTGLTQINNAVFTGDGRVLLLTSAESTEREFMKYCLIDLDKPKEYEVVYDPRMDSDGMTYNRETGVVIAVLNKDGYSTLKGFDLDGNDIAVPKTDIGVISEYAASAITSNDYDDYVFSFTSPTTPPTAFYFKLGENKPQQIGKVSTFGFDFSNIDVEVIRYESEDGTMVPSLIYKPANIARDGSNPAIIQYHGGPPSQSRPYFQRNIAFALSQGFIVMFPNVRGSTGYGPAWEEADNREGRFAALKDAEGAIDYLIDEGFSSPNKIAIWGGSYGGYTVNWLAGHASDKIACVVSQIAVSDFEHNLEYTGVQTFIEGYEKEYGERGSDLLIELSPIYYAKDVDVPIFFKTGFYDPRVPPSDSRRFASILKKLGKDVLLYEEMEAGHGGSGKEQIIWDLTSSYVFTMMHVMD